MKTIKIREVVDREVDIMDGVHVTIGGWGGYAHETANGVVVLFPGIALRGGAFEKECVTKR